MLRLSPVSQSAPVFKSMCHGLHSPCIFNLLATQRYSRVGSRNFWADLKNDQRKRFPQRRLTGLVPQTHCKPTVAKEIPANKCRSCWICYPDFFMAVRRNCEGFTATVKSPLMLTTTEGDAWPSITLCVLHSFLQVILEFTMSKELPTVLTEVQVKKVVNA